jgi:amino acid transporter
VRTMGTMPVFMTAVSTILGAILFLRFGYSVAHVGLFFTLVIIALGHLVTIPTAMAVAEIATNQRVEGGGAYYIISRSFGLNIGGAIGIALFMSQAISVAFYVIAFTLACGDLIIWVNEWIDLNHPDLPFRVTEAMLNYTLMGLLTVLMVTKGANVGVKALYIVVALLIVSLIMFFFGSTDYSPEKVDFFARVGGEGSRDTPDEFFKVFTIIFPAFTGIAAGLGLSGDLKDPKKSIPRGTLWATVAGIVVYVLVAFKLYFSAPQEALADDELIMQEIAIWGPIIPIGLACAAISSALGSIMIAPRTLQALGSDRIFPKRINRIMAKGRASDHEPVNASIVACIIGFLFVSLGELDVVAEIIAMFFMLTYGAICMVSFFEHVASDPAYRPTFKSRWYVSLLGGLLCFVLMFQMNFSYALAAIIIMVLTYLWISYTNKNRRGLENLFKGIIFQMTRKFQLLLQKRDYTSEEGHWRPFVFTISKDAFKRKAGFDMVRWLAHRYGFGTYIHFIEGFLNEETKAQARDYKGRLIKLTEEINSRLYLDTMISPSMTSAIAQSVQLPGISGKGNNMILFEYNEEDLTNFEVVVHNLGILRAAELDICLLRSTSRGFGFMKSINIWITSTDYENSNLMILLSYVLMGHPEWKHADVSIYSIFQEEDVEAKEERLLDLIKTGRLPISPANIQMIKQDVNEHYSIMINKHSRDADLTVVGFNDADIQSGNKDAFTGYDAVGNILFVNAHNELEIE